MKVYQIYFLLFVAQLLAAISNANAQLDAYPIGGGAYCKHGNPNEVVDPLGEKFNPVSKWKREIQGFHRKLRVASPLARGGNRQARSRVGLLTYRIQQRQIWMRYLKFCLSQKSSSLSLERNIPKAQVPHQGLTPPRSHRMLNDLKVETTKNRDGFDEHLRIWNYDAVLLHAASAKASHKEHCNRKKIRDARNSVKSALERLREQKSELQNLRSEARSDLGKLERPRWNYMKQVKLLMDEVSDLSSEDIAPKPKTKVLWKGSALKFALKRLAKWRFVSPQFPKVVNPAVGLALLGQEVAAYYLRHIVPLKQHSAFLRQRGDLLGKTSNELATTDNTMQEMIKYLDGLKILMDKYDMFEQKLQEQLDDLNKVLQGPGCPLSVCPSQVQQSFAVSLTNSELLISASSLLLPAGTEINVSLLAHSEGETQEVSFFATRVRDDNSVRVRVTPSGSYPWHNAKAGPMDYSLTATLWLSQQSSAIRTYLERELGYSQDGNVVHCQELALGSVEQQHTFAIGHLNRLAGWFGSFQAEIREFEGLYERVEQGEAFDKIAVVNGFQDRFRFLQQEIDSHYDAYLAYGNLELTRVLGRTQSLLGRILSELLDGDLDQARNRIEQTKGGVDFALGEVDALLEEYGGRINGGVSA